MAGLGGGGPTCWRVARGRDCHVGRAAGRERANVEALLAAPSCRVITEKEGFWDVYREVTKDAPTRRNLVPDAHLTALLSQHGVVTIYTHDRDFRKFSFLDVRDPVA